jgi:hypothetical protein
MTYVSEKPETRQLSQYSDWVMVSPTGMLFPSESRLLLFATAVSRLALETAQPLVQLVPGEVSEA